MDIEKTSHGFGKADFGRALIPDRNPIKLGHPNFRTGVLRPQKGGRSEQEKT
jgi:hypothetical protein